MLGSNRRSVECAEKPRLDFIFPWPHNQTSGKGYRTTSIPCPHDSTRQVFEPGWHLILVNTQPSELSMLGSGTVRADRTLTF